MSTVCSGLSARLHRDIRGQSHLRAGQSADGLSGGHALPRLRVLIRTGVVGVRAVSARRRRHPHLLAESQEHRHRPARHTRPSLMPSFRVQLLHATRCNRWCWNACNYCSALRAVIVRKTIRHNLIMTAWSGEPAFFSCKSLTGKVWLKRSFCSPYAGISCAFHMLAACQPVWCRLSVCLSRMSSPKNNERPHKAAVGWWMKPYWRSDATSVRFVPFVRGPKHLFVCGEII